MKTDLESYQERRESLLKEIMEKLSNDERFVAAWLTGSISRNEADSLSDIDLSLVVSDKYSTSLCTRLEQVSARTSPDRYALFSLFGNPALIHENNNNAPEGGTFTFVLYAESAAMIDWVLVPQSKAKRPLLSRLLFEKVAIPLAPSPEPEALEQSKKSVAEMWAFFWMMTAITIKYATRNDSVFLTEWTEHLHSLLYEIERRLNREPWKYTRGSLSKLQATREKQLESVRELCNRLLELKTKVSEFIGSEPVTPTSEIETLFSLAHNATHKSNPYDQT
jgi:hypothetical protein